MFGYDVTGSTGTLFLVGIVVGAVAMLGLSVVLGGARRTAGRGRDARRELKRSQRETEFLNRDRNQLLERQHVGTSGGLPVNSQGATTAATGFPCSVAGRAVDNRRAPRPSTDPVGTEPRSNTVGPQSRRVITKTKEPANEHR